MTSALIAVALVTPQSSTAVGVELVISAVLCGASLLTLDRRALDATAPGVARTIERFSLNGHLAVGRVPSLWQRSSTGELSASAANTTLAGSMLPGQHQVPGHRVAAGGSAGPRAS